MGYAPSPVALRPRFTPGLPFRSSSDGADGCDASKPRRKLRPAVPAFGYCGPDLLVGVVPAQRALATRRERAPPIGRSPFGAKACCRRDGKPDMVSYLRVLRAGASKPSQACGNSDA